MYWQLFMTFFKIGAFTIGGGYAMIPLIQREIVDKKKWIPTQEFIDMLAIAQSVPGVMAINTSVFVGYKLKGIKGSIVTSLGCALPSFLIILVLAAFFTEFRDNQFIERMFKGIRPAVVALIVAPLWKMSKSANITWKTVIIPVAIALLIWLCNVSPVLIIGLAIVGGIATLYFPLKQKKAKIEK